MIATVWMIYCTLSHRKMKHQIRRRPEWNAIVHAVKTPTHFMWIVYHMFQDRLFTRERLCVLEAFTEDVSALRHDPNYWSIYSTFCDVIERHKDSL